MSFRNTLHTVIIYQYSFYLILAIYLSKDQNPLSDRVNFSMTKDLCQISQSVIILIYEIGKFHREVIYIYHKSNNILLPS